MPTRFSRIMMTPMPRRKQIDVRRNKIVVADAGARRKKRGRRGVGVDELFVRINGNDDDQKTGRYDFWRSRNCVHGRNFTDQGVRPVSTVHEFSKTEVLPQGEKQATMQTVSPDRRQHSR